MNSGSAALLAKVRAANPDVLSSATCLDDVAIVRQMNALKANPKMYGATTGVDSLGFYEQLGRATEFVYGATQWVPELVALRAGGLIPIARQYPGAREFVEAYRKEFPRADLIYHAASGYSGCQGLVEAIRRAGSLDGEKIRQAILKMDLNAALPDPAVESTPVKRLEGPAPQRAHSGPRCDGVRASTIHPRTTAPKCRDARCDAPVAQAFELATQR